MTETMTMYVTKPRHVFPWSSLIPLLRMMTTTTRKQAQTSNRTITTKKRATTMTMGTITLIMVKRMKAMMREAEEMMVCGPEASPDWID